MDLTVLIARLEALQAPVDRWNAEHRQMDCDVLNACGHQAICRGPKIGWEWRKNGAGTWSRMPSPIGSVDTALTLVPDGLMISMLRGFDRSVVNVRTGSITNPETKEWSSYHPNWPVAICIAALKARAAQEPPR